MQGTGLSVSVHEGGQVTHAKPCHAMIPQETYSRDLAVMDEKCARAFSIHSGWDTTESSIQQSENIVLKHVCSPLFDLVSDKKNQEQSPPFFGIVAHTCLYSYIFFQENK
jgi:hypothetical protein